MCHAIERLDAGKMFDVLNREVREMLYELNLEIGEMFDELPFAWSVWEVFDSLNFQVWEVFDYFNFVVGEMLHYPYLAVDCADIGFSHRMSMLVCD